MSAIKQRRFTGHAIHVAASICRLTLRQIQRMRKKPNSLLTVPAFCANTSQKRRGDSPNISVSNEWLTDSVVLFSFGFLPLSLFLSLAHGYRSHVRTTARRLVSKKSPRKRIVRLTNSRGNKRDQPRKRCQPSRGRRDCSVTFHTTRIIIRLQETKSQN